jgi:SAM-dependent methyltransferase
MRLYDELAGWWPLMSPAEEYVEEAAELASLLKYSGVRSAGTLLEFGSGGGHLASHLKHHFKLTLTDLSEQMLKISRSLNPECRHERGDMRTLRFGECFDAVLIHDAISHLVDSDDVHAALTTAAVHCGPGGVGVFCPDFVTETFEPYTTTGGSDGPNRAMRYLEWGFTPGEGSGYMTEIAYLLRDANGIVRAEHDHADLGLFSRGEWLSWIEACGFARAWRHEIAGRDVFVGKMPDRP